MRVDRRVLPPVDAYMLRSAAGMDMKASRAASSRVVPHVAAQVDPRDDGSGRHVEFSSSASEVRPTGMRSFVVFGLAGAVGTVCQYLILVVLVHLGVGTVVIASTIGAVAGGVVNFLLNHHFTFAGQASVAQTGPRYFVLVVLSFVVNALVVRLLFDTYHYQYLVAQVIATGVVFSVNYILSSLWVFRHQRSKPMR